MKDKEIIELYFRREESAIRETKEKYGRYCRKIAYNITSNYEDTEEIESDTYNALWGKIPPEKPENFTAFIAKITRNLAFKLFRKKTSGKRGKGEINLVLEELGEIVSDNNSLDKIFERREIIQIINNFLSELANKDKEIFVDRYFHGYSLADISIDKDLPENTAKSILFRLRNELRVKLESEEIYI